MAVPNLNDRKGIFFETIEGFSDFEPNGVFSDAVPFFGYLSRVSYSGKVPVITDCSNFAYMPCAQSAPWIRTGTFGLDFSRDYPFSRDGYKGGIHLRFTRYRNKDNGDVFCDVPICIAKRGYRVQTSSVITNTWVFSGNSPAARVYKLFRSIVKNFVQSTTQTIITFYSNRIVFSGGVNETVSYESYRRWIGLGIQAGGEAGTNGGWGGNNGGGGGSAGGFWFGIVDTLRSGEGSMRLVVGGYDSGTNGHDGADISLQVNGTEVLRVNGGHKGGGQVTERDASYFSTYKSTAGGAGSGDWSGSSTSLSDYISPLRDEDSISFANFPGGGYNNHAGGGGASAFSYGGTGGGYAFGGSGGTAGEDMGAYRSGDTSKGYGAGGGGGSFAWFGGGHRGGSGGFPYIVIGY